MSDIDYLLDLHYQESYLIPAKKHFPLFPQRIKTLSTNIMWQRKTSWHLISQKMLITFIMTRKDWRWEKGPSFLENEQNKTFLISHWDGVGVIALVSDKYWLWLWWLGLVLVLDTLLLFLLSWKNKITTTIACYFQFIWENKSIFVHCSPQEIMTKWDLAALEHRRKSKITILLLASDLILWFIYRSRKLSLPCSGCFVATF